MLRDVLGEGALTAFAVVGLVIFVAVFLMTCAWVLSRTRSEVSAWSRIPLTSDEDGPVEDRRSPENSQEAA